MNEQTLKCAAIALLTVNEVKKLERSTSREASIFAILFMLKMSCPDEYEAALITFLRHGTEAINECERRIDDAED